MSTSVDISRWQWIESAGHAWLCVPLSQVESAGCRITPYSTYTSDSQAFLEEDQDAPTFMIAVGMEPGDWARIPARYVDPFSPPGKPFPTPPERLDI